MTTDATREMATLEIWKGPDAALRIGGLRLVACRREVDRLDGGVTLYVRDDPASGASRALLRLDLFRNRPHYHAPADETAETRIDAGEAGSLAWGIDAITTRIGELLAQGGFDDVARSLDADALAEAGPALQGLFDALGEPSERSTFDVPASLLAGLRRD